MVYASPQAARAALPWFNMLGLTQLFYDPLVSGFVFSPSEDVLLYYLTLHSGFRELWLGFNVSTRTMD